MKTALHSFILFVIIGLILASCSPATPTSVAPILPTATLDLSGSVNFEVTVQYDTAAVYNTVGQIVRFKYIIKMVKNDINDATPPNVTISGIAASCPPINTISNLNERFDPGEVLECTGDYILTQADLDKGSVTNVVTATVYTVSSSPVTTTVPTVRAKALTLTKTANPTTYSSSKQVITFTYTLTNSGATQLGPDQFTVTETGVNNNVAFPCGNPGSTLAPGAALTCTATYTVSDADMTAASISMSATATGGGATLAQPLQSILPKGTPVTATPGAASGTTIQHKVSDGEWLWQIARCYGADPAKTVAANPQLSNPAQLKAGMTVNVPNPGSVGTQNKPPCVIKHLVQSGDTWSSIAQKYNVDLGFLQRVNANTLTVGKEVKVPLYTAGLNYPTAAAPGTNPSTTALLLSVTANPTTYSQVGQVITLTYVVKNNGTTTLGPTQFKIADALINNSALFDCGPANTSLATGVSTTCTSSYTITQADMNAANVTNSATASGSGVPTSAAASVVVSKSVAAMTLSVAATPATYNQVGQVITLTYTIKNTGTSNLGPTQFTVNDFLINSNAPFNCGPANNTLIPSGTVTCTATYTIAQADVNAANITSKATAAGAGVPTVTFDYVLPKQ
jgi:LysM repeat protein